MNAPAFTPGPWTTHAIVNPSARVVLIESADNVIARVLVNDGSDLANARLIAAAPKLYDALDAIDSYAREAPAEVREQARAALAEAVQP